jgi:hypothetical protein
MAEFIVPTTERVNIHKFQFAKYIRVQKSGAVNMMKVDRVAMLAGLRVQTVINIQRAYDQLTQKFPETYNELTT